MIENLDKAFSLTLELEGLIVLAQNRQDMLPSQVYDMIRHKASEINDLLTVDQRSEEKFEKTDNKCESEAEQEDFDTITSESSKDISGLLKQFTLNDKFLFRRELFNNSQEAFNDALSVISTIPNSNEISEYLINDLCLDPENDSVKRFMDVVIEYFDSKQN